MVAFCRFSSLFVPVALAIAAQVEAHEPPEALSHSGFKIRQVVGKTHKARLYPGTLDAAEKDRPGIERGASCVFAVRI